MTTPVSRRLLACLAVLALLCTTSPARAGEACPVGTWNLSVEMDGGATLEFVTSIAQEGDKLVGTMVGEDGEEVTLQDVEYNDGELRFRLEREFQGGNLSTQFKGKLADGAFVGTVDYDLDGLLGTLTVTGKQQQPLDPVGAWDLSVFMDGGGTLEFVATIERDGDSLKGSIVGEDGEAIELENVQFADGKLSFKFNREFLGQQLAADFQGVPTGDEFKGYVDYDLDGATGSLDVTGKRSTPDIVGIWIINATADVGQTYQAVLTISRDGDALSAKYESVDSGAGSVKNLKYEKGEISFGVEHDFGGAILSVNWKGKLNGDVLSGNADYDLEGQVGTASFEAKRGEK